MLFVFQRDRPFICLLMLELASFSHNFVMDASGLLMLICSNPNTYFSIYANEVILA